MTYCDALKLLNQSLNYEAILRYSYRQALSLGRVHEALACLHNPQHTFTSILITGTNGKGSTAYMLEALLRHAGYRIGLYTSPHIDDIRERIRVDGSLVSKRSFATTIQAVHEQIPKKLFSSLTYFERLTVSALYYFSRQKVAYAVLEVGLGGRLDATNVVPAAVSVVTPVSFDHEHILGKTLRAIAREKAGIIKRGGRCIAAAQKKEVAEVLACVAAQRKSALTVLPAAARLPRGCTRALPVFQQQNALLAYRVYETIMSDEGISVSKNKAFAVLRHVRIPGRLERLSIRPVVYADGAHNETAIDTVIRTVLAKRGAGKVYLVCGFSRDKNIQRISTVLRRYRLPLVVTQAATPRALPAEEFARTYPQPFAIMAAKKTVHEALAFLIKKIRQCDTILIVGSFYLIADARRAVKKLRITTVRNHT